MLRIRRDLILSSLPKQFLLEPGVNSLRTAPLTADSLFGGRIQAAITADREDQIHASLARNNSGQRQGAFKRPASKPPAAKNSKNLFYKMLPSTPCPAPNRPSSYNRPFAFRNSSGKESWNKGKNKLDQKTSKPSPGKGRPPQCQP
ncbi:hypothetical protein DPMN_000890 [Dreissena polymorpha]|uniref:Uncharacterized protein n=1 Tax=Dreissena polymorpha TaxID=45954 RepID=A0A9D4RPW3_DREPO|nr:hypothetical protein DPMN_000890 [Dreissena polymorpha]